MIVSVKVILIMLLVIILGTFILYTLVNRKYGYTEERESELEHIDEKTLK